jgi:Fe-S cluster assembly protein SufD
VDGLRLLHAPDRGRGSTLHTFTAEASAALPGPDWLRRRRAAGFEAFASTPLPSESEEVWRYTPIDDLVLDDVTPAPATAPAPAGIALLGQLETALGSVAGSVLVHNGTPVPADAPAVEGIAFGPASEVASAEALLGSVQHGGDALVRLNDAFSADPVVIDVPAGIRVAGPLLVLHWCDAAGVAVFPRLCVRAGDGAAVSVVVVCAGPLARARALVVPVTELVAEDGAALAYVSLQTLPAADWSLARLAGRGAAGAQLRTFTVGLGAAYARVRADVAVVGKEAHSEILSTYLGDGTQVHDIRTLQDHVAPRTTSELLCQGAVAGTSRSVYSGLIRVHRGAVRSDARQTNHNLVLSEGAHADSVPNLDILENDVRCSHASTVGPVDEDQRYYIESRGVPPEEAEGLIVRGFFDAIVDRSPVPEAAALLEREVHGRLDRALAARLEPAGV